MTCPVCGPQPPPTIHTVCHDHRPPAQRNSKRGCGHPLADHSNSLKCRTCGVECGIDCTPVSYREAITAAQQVLL